MSHTISVIIPVYRATLQTLHDCVNSLQRQQGSGFRIEAVIVFDGEPAFETAPISNWNSPLVSIRTETIAHAGVSAARNAGLRAATGQWAMFLDVDDALAEHAVDGMLAFAVRYRCDVVMGAYRNVLAGADADANGVPDAAGAVIMGGKGEGSPSVEEHHYAETDMVFEGRRRLDLCEDMLRPQRGIALVWGKLYSMPLIKGIDGFNETLSLGEDAEYAFRAVAAANRIGYVDEMVYEYRRNADSAVRSFSNDYVRRTISAIETMRDTIRQFREISDGTLDDYTLFHLTIIMINDLFNPEAPWNRHERKNHYGKVVNMPVFRQPLDRYRGGRFPVTRQIALLSMKYRWYYVSAAIAWVRHKQFSGKQ
ncbi:glycosyltransferase [Bifidobacterium pseudocatenulatum]|jgi:glycosyltransferase involved in cell wall biosynthesis|uniref:glycosyltransferase n=1 Tax=Bifidobacterium pseudocatenulatum TaxID=28026 RepID=UPI0022E3C16C|nr:glycosyltransferase [Bifidobacterium pseudocatenulatum]